MAPTVSVIMAVYNGEAFLAEALASVLGQAEVDYEVLVVDDGSSDGTRHIAERFSQKHRSFRVLHQANAGVTIARNHGVAEARGEFLAFLDQDDRWCPGALATHLRAFRAEPALACTVSHQRCFLEPGASCPDWFRLQPLGKPLPAYLPGGMVVRRSAFDELGGFDPQYPVSSDADWFARARDAGLVMRLLPEVTLERRIHRANQSSQAELIHRELFRLLRASIERKRRGAT